MMATPFRVLKLGGSLLAWPGLRDALRAWRERNPYSHDLLVVGGGKAADWVREADETHQLGDDAAHRLAIQAMQLNAQLAESLWPEALTLTRLDAIAGDHIPSGYWILQPWPLLSDQEQARYGEVLPHSWSVTSDSIAAWVATAIDAAELVLFKSSLPVETDIRQCAVNAYVDPYFPAAAQGVHRIRAVNLRSESFESRDLH